MKLIDLTCSKCGATLQVNQDLRKCMCQYCGNEMLIDDEIIHHSIDNGFDFGYQAELGRIQAQKEQKEQIQQIQKEYFINAGRLVIGKNKASIGMIQRAYKISFNRAAQIMDQLEEAGVVSKECGTSPRNILMTINEFNDYITNKLY